MLLVLLTIEYLMEDYIPGEESTPKQEFLTQKLNFQNAVTVQRGSFLPIPIEYTIPPLFHSTNIKR